MRFDVLKSPRSGIFGAAAACAIALTAGFAQPVSADPVELIFDIFIPRQAGIVANGMAPWAEEVTKASNGALKITIPNAPMAPPPRIFDALQDGVFDIAVSPLVMRENAFQLGKIFNIPMVAKGSTAQASVAFMRTYKKYFEPANEFKDFVPLALFALGGNHFMTAGRPITVIGDFDGLKFRGDGKEALDMLAAFGAAPVGAPGIKMFELMNSHVTDGTMAQPGPASQLGLAGIITDVTTLPGGLFRPTFCICMNRDSFEKLSPDMQNLLMEHSGETLAGLLGAQSDAEDAHGLVVMKEKGAKFVPASDALVADILKRAAFVQEDWLKIAADRGVDGPAALDYFIAQSVAK